MAETSGAPGGGLLERRLEADHLDRQLRFCEIVTAWEIKHRTRYVKALVFQRWFAATQQQLALRDFVETRLRATAFKVLEGWWLYTQNRRIATNYIKHRDDLRAKRYKRQCLDGWKAFVLRKRDTHRRIYSVVQVLRKDIGLNATAHFIIQRWWNIRCAKALEAWRDYTQARKRTRFATSLALRHLYRSIARRAFRGWHAHTASAARDRRALVFRDMSLMARGLRRWKQATEERKDSVLKEAMALALWARNAKARMFYAWKQVVLHGQYLELVGEHAYRRHHLVVARVHLRAWRDVAVRARQHRESLVLADDFYEARLKQKAFGSMVDRFRAIHALHTRSVVAVDHMQRWRLSAAFAQWRVWARAEQAVRVLDEKRAATAVASAFDAWRAYTVRRSWSHKVNERIATHYRGATLGLCFGIWRERAATAIEEGRANRAADAHHAARLLRTAFAAWHHDMRLTKRYVKACNFLATKSRAFVLQRCFGAWREWTQRRVYHHAIVAETDRRATLRRYLTKWVDATRAAVREANNEAIVAHAQALRNRAIKRDVMLRWRSYARSSSKEEARFAVAIETYRLRKLAGAYAAWKRHFVFRTRSRVIISTMTQKTGTTVVHRVFAAWRDYTRGRAYERMLQIRAIQWWYNRKLAIAWAPMRALLRKAQANRKLAEAHARRYEARTLHAAFNTWRTYVADTTALRLKTALAVRHRGTRFLQSAFGRLTEYTRKCVRARQILGALHEHTQRRKATRKVSDRAFGVCAFRHLNHAFSGWQHLTRAVQHRNTTLARSTLSKWWKHHIIVQHRASEKAVLDYATYNINRGRAQRAFDGWRMHVATKMSRRVEMNHSSDARWMVVESMRRHKNFERLNGAFQEWKAWVFGEMERLR